MSQLECLRDIVKDKYPRLRVEENVDEHWIVISRLFRHIHVGGPGFEF